MPFVFRLSLFLPLLAVGTVACADTVHYGDATPRKPTNSLLASGTATAPSSSSAAVRKDPFEDAPSYAPGLPEARATTTHANASVGVVPSKDVKCLGCHGSGGDDATAPKFAFGGSVYETSEAVVGAKDMELGVVDANGKALLVHSDEDGNFWALGMPELAFPAYAAVRSATATKAMKKKIVDATELECNSCHDTSNPISMSR